MVPMPRITVLYGSQTGNSRQAAQDLCIASDCCSCAMELDDWLAKPVDDTADEESDIWIIFVSSYGVGGAPLGALQFRSVCDGLLEDDKKEALQGIRYAVCGLGNSNFTTYLNNPRTIFRALSHAGATPLLDMAECDANADDMGEAAIASFSKSVIEELLPQQQNQLSGDELRQVRTALQDTARRVVENWHESGSQKIDASSPFNLPALLVVLALLVAGIAYGMGRL